MVQAVSGVDSAIASIPEIKSYEITINNNRANIMIVLTKK